MATLTRYNLREEYELIRAIEDNHSVAKGCVIHAKAYGRTPNAVAQRYYNYTNTDIKKIKEDYVGNYCASMVNSQTAKTGRTILQKANSINKIFQIAIDDGINLCKQVLQYHGENHSDLAITEFCEEIAFKYDVKIIDAFSIYNYCGNKTQKLFRKRV